MEKSMKLCDKIKNIKITIDFRIISIDVTNVSINVQVY